MIAVLMALLSSLLLNVLSGSFVHLLWNFGPASFEGVPQMSWLTGVACYLLIRIIIAPPKLSFDLNTNH